MDPAARVVSRDRQALARVESEQPRAVRTDKRAAPLEAEELETAWSREPEVHPRLEQVECLQGRLEPEAVPLRADAVEPGSTTEQPRRVARVWLVRDQQALRRSLLSRWRSVCS